MSLKFILTITTLVLQSIVFILCAIAIPADVFHKDSVKFSYGTGSVCFSMWGIKRCGDNLNDGRHFPCQMMDDYLAAASAFALLPMLTSLIIVAWCVLVLTDCVKSHMLTIIFGVVGAVSLLVSWSMMLGAYRRDCTFLKRGESFESQDFHLDLGFACVIVAMGVQIAAILVVIFAK